MQCDCGLTKDVRQSKKRGRYLYTVCESCGLDQRTGAPVQNAIWKAARFSVDVVKPSNVTDDWQPKASKPVTEQQGEPLTKPVSEVEQSSVDLTLDEIEAEATEAVESKANTKRKSPIKAVIGGVLLCVGFVGAIWAAV
jgi:hypothetical protein